MSSDEVNKLRDCVDFITVCPEQDIGLGVPRKPIDLVHVNGVVSVIQSETGRDLTAKLKEFSETFLEKHGKVDGFILKSSSPSCGHRTTTIRNGSTVNLGSGVFASCVENCYPDHAIIDEEELENIGAEAFLRLLAAS